MKRSTFWCMNIVYKVHNICYNCCINIPLTCLHLLYDLLIRQAIHASRVQKVQILGTPPARGRHTAPHRSQRFASEALVFVHVIATRHDHYTQNKTMYLYWAYRQYVMRTTPKVVAILALTGSLDRLLALLALKYWQRSIRQTARYTITGLSSLQRVTLEHSAPKRPLLLVRSLYN